MLKPLIFLVMTIVAFSSFADEYDKENFKILDLGEKATSYGWYVPYQINENTYAILVPKHWQETVSYLFVGTEKALLIDTGMGFGNIKDAVDAITNLPIIVANSHTHYDHVSNNYLFDTVYGRDHEFTKKNASGHPKSTWQNALQPSAVSDHYQKGFHLKNMKVNHSKLPSI